MFVSIFPLSRIPVPIYPHVYPKALLMSTVKLALIPTPISINKYPISMLQAIPPVPNINRVIKAHRPAKPMPEPYTVNKPVLPCIFAKSSLRIRGLVQKRVLL